MDVLFHFHTVSWNLLNLWTEEGYKQEYINKCNIK